MRSSARPWLGGRAAPACFGAVLAIGLAASACSASPSVTGPPQECISLGEGVVHHLDLSPNGRHLVATLAGSGGAVSIHRIDVETASARAIDGSPTTDEFVATIDDSGTAYTVDLRDPGSIVATAVDGSRDAFATGNDAVIALDAGGDGLDAITGEIRNGELLTRVERFALSGGDHRRVSQVDIADATALASTDRGVVVASRPDDGTRTTIREVADGQTGREQETESRPHELALLGTDGRHAVVLDSVGSAGLVLDLDTGAVETLALPVPDPLTLTAGAGRVAVGAATGAGQASQVCWTAIE